MSDTSEPQSTPVKKAGLARHLPLIAVVLVAVIGAATLKDYLSFDTLRDNREALVAFRDQNFLAMLALFMGIYVVIVAFSLPGAAVASVTGGFLFGLGTGTFANVVAATIGATGIFLAARWGLGSFLNAKIENAGGRVQSLKNALRNNEIEVLLLLRLVPAVPFFVANLLPALVGVKLRNFLWTTAVGIVPGGIVFTWIGVGLGEVFDRGENPDLSLLWEPHIIGPILGLCVLAAMPIVIKAVRPANTTDKTSDKAE
ncbi:TVP38/TMEM64 family protein [Epibacterium sp. SM1979]|uniref:TVP38/TMEM64 family membrane protein n=1 Tax=Tritonibacter litoralis TaxID=2662264 RepID=A0A843YH43_9RHOB|nr:VTT domain-containing protein [Tritonibacter litoralis]MQQ08459.1 TVP38/TMEM64 family protein [Tritonibacter litoralis]